MQSIMVVGATGFIGKHLVNKLLDMGKNVTIFILKNDSMPTEWQKKVSVIRGNITDKTTTKGIFDKIDIVFHLAAHVHDFSTSKEQENKHYLINVEGTRNLLQEASKANIKQFIFFSSIKAMAENSMHPIDESFSPTPLTPYGKSKLAAEKLVEEYSLKSGFNSVILRFPMVYGPGNKGNIYKMIEAIDKNRFILIGRGLNKRSIVYVDNIIDASVKILGYKNKLNNTFIVTDGINYTVSELYESIAKGLNRKKLSFYIPLSIAKIFGTIGTFGEYLTHRNLPISLSKIRKLTDSFVVSSKKIEKEINFQPKYNLFNTLNKTINWYKNV